jgi:large subunit ribosomal protein L23
MSLFNTQRKKAGSTKAGEEKLSKPGKVVDSKKAVASKTEKLPKAEKVAEAKTKSVNEKRAAAAAGVTFPKGAAVIKPRVTEKAGLLSQNGVYTFDVRIDANSRQIAEAIKAAYKVTPVRVSVAPVKSKTMFARGKAGRTISGKKAYVYLKKGETIEFI